MELKEGKKIEHPVFGKDDNLIGKTVEHPQFNRGIVIKHNQETEMISVKFGGDYIHTFPTMRLLRDNRIKNANYLPLEEQIIGYAKDLFSKKPYLPKLEFETEIIKRFGIDAYNKENNKGDLYSFVEFAYIKNKHLQKHLAKGSGGYNEYAGKSNRALRAENEKGLFTIKDLSEQLGLTQKFLNSQNLPYEEWHHTGDKFKQTYYYSLRNVVSYLLEFGGFEEAIQERQATIEEVKEIVADVLSEKKANEII